MKKQTEKHADGQSLTEAKREVNKSEQKYKDIQNNNLRLPLKSKANSYKINETKCRN